MRCFESQGCAQPRVQRTRLRRGATLAVCKQRNVANNASGQTRRAADAIVGQGVEEEAR